MRVKRQKKLSWKVYNPLLTCSKEYDDVNNKMGEEEYYSDADKMDKLLNRQAALQKIDATDALESRQQN